MGNESLDIIFEEIKQRRAVEFSRLDALVIKTSIIVALTIILFPPMLDFPFRFQIFIITRILGLFSLIFSLFYSLKTIRLEKYRIDPKLDTLVKDYRNRKPEETKQALVANYLESIKQIEKIATEKARTTKRSFCFLCSALFFYIVSKLLELLIRG